MLRHALPPVSSSLFLVKPWIGISPCAKNIYITHVFFRSAKIENEMDAVGIAYHCHPRPIKSLGFLPTEVHMDRYTLSKPDGRRQVKKDTNNEDGKRKRSQRVSHTRRT
jgi:hypothetical protein